MRNTKNIIHTTCPKCGGYGFLETYYYNQDGICFMCEGSGKVESGRKIVAKTISQIVENAFRKSQVLRSRTEKHIINNKGVVIYGVDIYDQSYWNKHVPYMFITTLSAKTTEKYSKLYKIDFHQNIDANQFVIMPNDDGSINIAIYIRPRRADNNDKPN